MWIGQQKFYGAVAAAASASMRECSVERRRDDPSSQHWECHGLKCVKRAVGRRLRVSGTSGQEPSHVSVLLLQKRLKQKGNRKRKVRHEMEAELLSFRVRYESNRMRGGWKDVHEGEGASAAPPPGEYHAL
ncbi:hypothetical protein cyc_02420 [Cyclospora cayetanensis]|uniref:Uncharacterized protein n=1 Tax=Cyclospora cayetanensis TaxID=88456 RepID=A0A1D3CYY2_9EIME|nr:hypothetical protein cyc_02420 [Cyclospora cayetanensis]